MKLKKPATGEYVTIKEFIKQWQDGMKNVTPLQQAKSNQLGYLIVFIGIIWGLIMCIKIRQWWLLVILTGSFIITGTSYHANWIKKKVLQEIEMELKPKKKMSKFKLIMCIIYIIIVFIALARNNYWFALGWILSSIFMILIKTKKVVNENTTNNNAQKI